MDHACYSCGASVEDGTPFCPQCNSPQIRVVGQADLPVGLPEIIREESAPANRAIQWRHALPSAALAGLFAAFFMFIPLGALGLGMITAGALGVLFYRHRDPAINLTPAVGARLGALSGALGFGIFAVFAAIEFALFRSGGTLRAAMIEAIDQSAARSSDPQAQQVVEYLKSPPGLVLMMVTGMAVLFLAFLIFSSIGGTLGAILLRRRGRQ